MNYDGCQNGELISLVRNLTAGVPKIPKTWKRDYSWQYPSIDPVTRFLMDFPFKQAANFKILLVNQNENVEIYLGIKTPFFNLLF